MSTVLISFLGRQRRFEGGYRPASYRFPDGEVVETRYFARALRRRLDPGRIVLFGTASSMWDVLSEDCDAGADLWAEVAEAVDRAVVDRPLLGRVAEKVSAAWGCEVRLGLIPFGLDETGQVAILNAMAEAADGMERVHLDVTHGFRSLPMLALMAAFYLEVVRGIKIAGIHYGMFDARDEHGETPVVRLDGLLRFGRWIGALRQYDKDGDYSVFATLLGEAGVEEAGRLAEAAFFERTGNVRDAARRISTLHCSLEEIDSARFPAAAMFVPALRERIGWFRKPSLAAREWALAEEYLERRDYFRALLLALEAALTAELERRGIDAADFDARRKVHDELRESNGHYRRLNSLRNQVAHGSRERSRDLERVLRDETTLSSTLRGLMKEMRRG